MTETRKFADAVYSIHAISRGENETNSDVMHRHLTTKHGRIVPPGTSLGEMLHLHCRLHSAIGNQFPDNESARTRKQKEELVARLVAINFTLPEWVVTHSFLADLRTLERVVTSAYLAQPGIPFPQHTLAYACCSHCDHSRTQPDAKSHDRPCSEPGCQDEMST